jgi:ribosomal peptide maturation radical SAM protein 1
MKSELDQRQGQEKIRTPTQTDIVFISMPFGTLHYPPIGLSLLKSALKPLDATCKICYFSLRFARLIGPSLYQRLADSHPVGSLMLGEWIFRRALFDEELENKNDEYIELLLGKSLPSSGKIIGLEPISEGFLGQAQVARNNVEPFLDDCLERILVLQPKIVGFTSVFQQHIASLALAKRIKMRAPHIFIVFGGANCEGCMGTELVQQFPFVDASVSGEGDQVVPELERYELHNDSSWRTLQGVYSCQVLPTISAASRIANTPIIRHMDDLPIPDYKDFFEQWHDTAMSDSSFSPIMTFETSRGCWWGEKSHCTFCGLNGSTMLFRGKSAHRALDELVTLTSTYGISRIAAVDNILDMKYFKDFLPELAARRINLDLFYEVKANLRKEQLRMLRDAGTRTIQPGIESLSSNVLKLMRKGVKALQNIQLLKWCQELGIRPLWNLLYGFPGESLEEYERMNCLIPLLAHLQPPAGVGQIRLDRFSPNFEMAEQFGFVDVAPHPAYSYIYPFSQESLSRLAYFFTYHYQQPQDVDKHGELMMDAVEGWRNCHSSSALLSQEIVGNLLIWDLRPIASSPLTVLVGLNKRLYQACDGMRSPEQLWNELTQGQTDAPAYALQDVEEGLETLVKRKLMVRDRLSYLSLAIPLGDYVPSSPIRDRLKEVVQQLSKMQGSKVVIPLEEFVLQV